MDPATILQLALHDLGGSVRYAGLLTGLLWAICTLPGAFSAFILPPRFTDPRFCAALHLPSIAFSGLLALLFYFFPSMDASRRLELMLLFSFGFFFNIGMLAPHWIGLLQRCIPEDFQGRYFGWSLALASLGSIFFGALAARWISAWGLSLGYGRCFALSMLLQLLSVCFLACLKPLKERPQAAGPFRAFARRQWELITTNQGFIGLIILFMLIQFCGAPWNFYTECLRGKGLATSWWELYIPAKNAGAVLGSFLIGFLADRFGPRLGLYLAFGVMALSLAVMVFAGSAPLYAFAFLGAGFFGSVFPVLNVYFFLQLAGPGESASFSGTFWSLSSPLIFVAPFLMAALAGQAGYNPVFGLSALLCGLAFLYVRQRSDFDVKAPKASL